MNLYTVTSIQKMIKYTVTLKQNTMKYTVTLKQMMFFIHLVKSCRYKKKLRFLSFFAAIFEFQPAVARAAIVATNHQFLSGKIARSQLLTKYFLKQSI